MVQLVRWGQTTLAADHLLFPELNGFLPAIVGGIIRQLNIGFVDARVLATDSEADAAAKFARGIMLTRRCWRPRSISMAPRAVGSMQPSACRDGEYPRRAGRVGGRRGS